MKISVTKCTLSKKMLLHKMGLCVAFWSCKSVFSLLVRVARAVEGEYARSGLKSFEAQAWSTICMYPLGSDGNPRQVTEILQESLFSRLLTRMWSSDSTSFLISFIVTPQAWQLLHHYAEYLKIWKRGENTWVFLTEWWKGEENNLSC